MSESVQLLVAAAGSGSRLGRPEPKALVPIAGVPLLVRTLAPFDAVGLARSAIVMHPPDAGEQFAEVLESAFPGHSMRLAAGGNERQDSVRIGLNLIGDDVEMVVLHDAARPFIDANTINAALESARAYGGATVAVPSVDTILRGNDDDMLVDTPDRRRLWACQTPQVFRTQPFIEAHARAYAEGATFTDDATLFRHFGGSVKIVRGMSENRKITTEEDLLYAEYRLDSTPHGSSIPG